MILAPREGKGGRGGEEEMGEWGGTGQVRRSCVDNGTVDEEIISSKRHIGGKREEFSLSLFCILSEKCQFF